MIAVVSESLMEETWQRVARSSDTQMRQLQKLCGKEQEELTGFMVAFSSDLPEEVMGLALYLHAVVSDAFRHAGVKFRRIKPARIMRTWEIATELVADLEPHGRPCPLSIASATSEPAVFRYILEALETDPEDHVELSDKEYWHVVAVLLTVMTCLHDAVKTRTA